jgi:hypothetical protein
MRDPAGAPPRALEATTDAELVQLVVRRYAERAVAESERYHSGFLSDGSLLHEWVYATIRIAVGLHPPDGTELDVPLSRTANPYAEVIAQIGAEAMRRSGDSYDAFVHLPIEFPLNDPVKPIGERFRLLSDQFLLDSLRRQGATIHTVNGTPAARLDTLMQIIEKGSSLCAL